MNKMMPASKIKMNATEAVRDVILEIFKLFSFPLNFF